MSLHSNYLNDLNNNNNNDNNNKNDNNNNNNNNKFLEVETLDFIKLLHDRGNTKELSSKMKDEKSLLIILEIIKFLVKLLLIIAYYSVTV